MLNEPATSAKHDCARDGHNWEHKLYSARCPDCGRSARCNPCCQTCERAFPDKDPPSHECPDRGMLHRGAAPLGAPGMYPFRVAGSRRPRNPVEFDPTGHGAFVQGMFDAMFPTLRQDTEVSVLKGIQDGIAGVARRDRDSRTWERLCRRWASKHESCPTCGEAYGMPPTFRAMVCSDGFHLCRRCTWADGRRAQKCERCEAETGNGG